MAGSRIGLSDSIWSDRRSHVLDFRSQQRIVKYGTGWRQGILVSLLACLYFVMDNVSVAFFVLTAMTATLYLVMYMMMYAAAIRLRYTHPELPRTYKIPCGNTGMWVISLIGLAGVIFACIVGFFPPTNLPVGNPALYVGLVAGGMILFTGTPFVIHGIMQLKKQQQQQK